MRQTVGAPPARPVIRNEDRVRAGSSLRPSPERSSSERRVVTRTQSPSSMPYFAASAGWISQLRLGILFHQRTDAPRLRAGQIVADDASGGQEKGYSLSTGSPLRAIR